MNTITEEDIRDIAHHDIVATEVTEDDVYRYASVVGEVAKAHGIDNAGPNANDETHAFALSLVALMTLALSAVKAGVAK